ncbi:lipoprotein NlpD, partial [Pseudomonas aeruginosa]|uniref:hypothetical protein n=1 Tax=Pseudomonas aeruginosa TaxID=287 RepID=UPI000FF63925
MNSERPIKHIRWAILCSVVGFALTGCADTPYRPAPITSVKDGSSNNTVSNTPVMNSGATPVERSSATPLQSAPPSSIKTNSSPNNINTSQPQNRPVQNTATPRN